MAARTLVVPLTAALVWAAAPQASAHTGLLSSSPSDGATVDALPSDVRLTFSDEMSQQYAKVALTGPDGSPAGEGEPRVEGKSATLTVKPGLPAGRYTVGYRVVSADGHPVAGSYTFTVKETAGATPPPASSPASSAAASPSTYGPASPTASSPQAGSSRTGASNRGALSALVLAGVLIIAGAGGAVLLMRRKKARHDG
ncbi:copper resistance CopC family protein [Streptomyces sp. NBC_00239]|uniref:copper resistance CopC family protein n=1 Tax=Streptomyces sp. NBC_00239 TaxID=2903640 RepID=UPI002E2DCEDB|nr:copper resistance CopC family protein [Streptomyces sp. NBC_00239]